MSAPDPTPVPSLSVPATPLGGRIDALAFALATLAAVAAKAGWLPVLPW